MSHHIELESYLAAISSTTHRKDGDRGSSPALQRREVLLSGLSQRHNVSNGVSDGTVLVDHAMWITRVREHVYGSVHLDPKMVGRDDDCVLGGWLLEAEPHMRHLPDYWRCRALHARWHDQAARVVELANQGRKLEAEQALAPGGQLRCLSAELVSTFARLRNQCPERVARAIPAHDFEAITFNP